MQAIRPNSQFNYQSLDLPYHYCCTKSPDRVFRYSHTININDAKFNIKVGTAVQLRDQWLLMGIESKKPDGFSRAHLKQSIIKRVFVSRYTKQKKHTFFYERDFGKIQ